jgi:hypothetical protein
VSGAITVKLNNLGAAECNVIRLLFKGTLDTFFEINKVSLSHVAALKRCWVHKLDRKNWGYADGTAWM